jgi:membrane fusion protein, multidrug efflux system
MKKLLPITLIALFVFSCSEENKKDKLKADLKAKQEEFEKLRKEITQIRMELVSMDSTGGSKGKPVKLQTVALTPFAHSIDIQGRIDAEQSVTVGPQMPGLIRRVNVQAGDKVSAGQVLAELDVAAMTQQLATVRTQRDLAKQMYDRQKNLWEQKIGSEMQYLQAKTQYEALESQMATIQDQINMGRVTAPMGGTVDQVNMKVGEMAMVGFSNIIIVNTNMLRVKAEVAEGYVSRVKIGNTVNVYLPDAKKTIQAKVTYAGRMINKLNRTFSVEVALPSNEPDVFPNMVAVLKISDYQNDSAIVVPMNCVQETSNGTQFVYVLKKDASGKTVAEKREVVVEHTYNGAGEITSGLKPGDQLVVEGYSDLNPGDEISGK